MIDVTVKTLDSQNHFFSVEDDLSVQQFKEHISPTLSIPVEQQRVIFRGQVLQNDKKLREYNVANNTVHVVQNAGGHKNTPTNHPPPTARPPDSEDEDDDGDEGIFIAVQGRSTTSERPRNNEPQGRGTGAQRRLMVGNQMLNRASTMLDNLEEFAAAPSSRDSTSRCSPEANYSTGEHGELNGSLLSTENRARACNPILEMINAPLGQSPQTLRHSDPGQPSSSSNQRASTLRQPETARLRDFAVALQNYLIVQERLTPYLRFIQNALQQNRLYTLEGESSSVQFVYDTVSSAMHLMAHSLHAFSEIITDFNLPPDNRSLVINSSILVQQATLVHASIAFPANLNPLAMLAGGARGAPSQDGEPQQSATQSRPRGEINAPTVTVIPVPPMPGSFVDVSTFSEPTIPDPGTQSVGQMVGPSAALRDAIAQHLTRTFNSEGRVVLPPQNSERQQSSGNAPSRLEQQAQNESSRLSGSTANDVRPPDSRDGPTIGGGNSSTNDEGPTLEDLLNLTSPGRLLQFDLLLPCHTHHRSHEQDISPPDNPNMPTELRRFFC